ncbi:MAG: DMT family transporter [Holosporaceae bacterium]|jgi:S-adenosylmethionine uptake transporter|nr:DMT family transporter [Holosporaceae bacterium]
MEPDEKNYWRGLFFLLLMMTVSCFNDIIVKFIGRRLDAFQVIFFRFFFGLVTLLPFIISGGKRIFRTKRPVFNIVRGILGAAGFFLYTCSVIHLPLVEVVTIFWSVPIFVMLLSVRVLKEQIPVSRWAAAVIGFFGLSFISVYDNGTSFSPKMIYIVPVASCVLFAVQDVMIKKNADRENRITMLLYFAAVSSLVSLVPAILVWKTPTPLEYLGLFLLGAGGNLIQYFIFKAFCFAELSSLSPYRYTEFLISAAFAFLLFGEIPGANVLVGALVLIPSTLFLAYTEIRKTVRRRKRVT